MNIRALCVCMQDYAREEASLLSVKYKSNITSWAVRVVHEVNTCNPLKTHKGREQWPRERKLCMKKETNTLSSENFMFLFFWLPVHTIVWFWSSGCLPGPSRWCTGISTEKVRVGQVVPDLLRIDLCSVCSLQPFSSFGDLRNLFWTSIICHNYISVLSDEV